MSAALVEVFNNQPMTTSLAIADGTGNEHKSVIQLVRKYIDDLQEFGTSAFEMRKSSGRATEVALLNEQQATLLITYLKNTEIVRKFKIALVKAFFELRDRATQNPHTNNPLSLSHRADIRVAADRTFRSVIRACRVAGTKLPQALKRANEITLHETGINMMEDLQIEMPVQDVLRNGNHIQFFNEWMAGNLPVPFAPCKTSSLYSAYEKWANQHYLDPMPINIVNKEVMSFCGCKRKAVRILSDKDATRFFVPVGNWVTGIKRLDFGFYYQQFEHALDSWK